MSKSLEIDYLKPFIEATITSSARFRRVLIVLIISSVLVFSAFWNSRDGGWLNSRVKLSHKAENYLLKQENFTKQNENLLKTNSAITETDNELNDSKLNETQKNDLKKKKDKLLSEKEKLTNEINNLDKELTTNYIDEKNWLSHREITSSAQLKPIVDKLEGARIDYITLIRVPFFGIVIDINDIGFLGGFTFVVVLMWFRFSLWREYYNLTATFREAKPEHLEYCYKTLAMNQVLTVPPPLNPTLIKEKPQGKIVRILYFLPAVAHLTVWGYDLFFSFDLGKLVSEFNTMFGTVTSSSFLALNLLLTYWCYQLSDDIDEEWNKMARKLQDNTTYH